MGSIAVRRRWTRDKALGPEAHPKSAMHMHPTAFGKKLRHIVCMATSFMCSLLDNALPCTHRHTYNMSSYRLNDPMESKVGKSSRGFYEAPLGYSIEGLQPSGAIKKFRSDVYSNARKRPMNKKELSKNEDIIETNVNSLTVHETKFKVLFL